MSPSSKPRLMAPAVWPASDVEPARLRAHPPRGSAAGREGRERRRDGTRAREICDLADRHRALVMVDDSHATGLLGPTGRGTPEHREVGGRIDIVTSTLGKALGGASGGFTTGRHEIVQLLRARRGRVYQGGPGPRGGLTGMGPARPT